jgi:hypothetical protein
MEKFYLSMLSYAGLSYDDAIIKNTNHDLGPITIDGKHLTLPYFDNLKNPGDRLIFHPLNENYTNPEKGGDISTSVVYQNPGWPVGANQYALQ